MSKNDSFWDNPFGGLFDFNGDGKEDLGEQWIGFNIFEECFKEDEEDDFDDSEFDDLFPEKDYSWREYVEVDYLLDVFPEDYETEEEYLEAFNEAKYAWREDCEDGYEYGIDSEDYETEEEYEEALEEAKEIYGEDCYSDNYLNLELKISVVPSFPEEDNIKESDYPNKRRYEAAKALAIMFFYGSGPEDELRRKSCCEFIIENADKILAANYCTYNKGFLYAQAVKDNFVLPVSLPEEDEVPKYSFVEVIKKVSKKNVDLAMDVWAWLVENFLPYAHYTERGEKELTVDLIDVFLILPDDLKSAIAHYLNNNPEFCNTILSSYKDVASGLYKLISVCINEKLFELAIKLFEFGLENANGYWKEINKLTENTIRFGKPYSDLGNIEFIQSSILPLVKEIDIGMVQDEIEGWEKELDECIAYIGDGCE